MNAIVSDRTTDSSAERGGGQNEHRLPQISLDWLAIAALLGQLCLLLGSLVTHTRESQAAIGWSSIARAAAYPIVLAATLVLFLVAGRRLITTLASEWPRASVAVTATIVYGLSSLALFFGARMLGLTGFTAFALIGAALMVYPLVRFGVPRLTQAGEVLTVVPGMLIGTSLGAWMQTEYKLLQSMSEQFMDPNALLGAVFSVMALGLGVALAPIFASTRLEEARTRHAALALGALLAVASLLLIWLNRAYLVPRLYLKVHMALAVVEWLLMVGAVSWLTVAAGWRASSLQDRTRTAIRASAVVITVIAALLLSSVPATPGRPIPRRVDYQAQMFATPIASLTDVDADGFMPLYLGGGDCAEGNADRNPLAAEIPGNDIDESCSGQDLPVRDLGAPIVSRRPETQADLTIIITIDMLRPDFMSVYGAEEPTTPYLDEHRGEWHIFERAYTSGGITTLGLPSLLTGRIPMALDFETVFRTTENRYVFPEDRQPSDTVNRAFLSPRSDPHPTLADVFSDAGRETYAVVDDGPARVFQKGLGYERGFTTFFYPNEPEGPGMASWGLREVTDKTLEVVEDAPTGSLVWVHYYDPHAARPPCREFDPTPGLGCYRDAIRDSDRAISRIADKLEALGRWDDSAVFITSDHGEALGEHGIRHHGLGSYEEYVRIPLLAKLPGRDGGTHSPPVSLVDVTSTAAATSAIPPPESFHGDDLRALVDGAARRYPVVSQLLLTEVDGTPYRQQTLVVDDTLRLMFDRVTGRGWLFELDEDPEQVRPLDSAEIAGRNRSLADAIGYGREFVEILESDRGDSTIDE